MSRWRIVFTKQAQKDAKKVTAAGLRDTVQVLLDVIAEDSFRSPPQFEKPVGDLASS